MKKGYKRVQNNFNKEDIARVPHDRAPLLGPVTPCNCKQTCPYGNGKSFCWPCYKNLMDEHRAAKAKNSMQAAPAM